MNKKQIFDQLDILLADTELSDEAKNVIKEARTRLVRAKTTEEWLQALALLVSLLDVGIKLVEIIQT